MKALMSWSGGKDSALALHAVRRDHPGVTVECRHATANRQFGRISSHGVRRELVALQAGLLGLPLVTSWVEPAPPSGEGSGCPTLVPNTHYERSVNAFYAKARGWGV